MSTIKITIDNNTVVRILVVVVLFLLGVNFLGVVAPALTLIGISAFLAMALNPPVTYLSSKITGGSRGAATGIAYLIILTILAVFLSAMIPPLVSQMSDFIDNFPAYVDDATSGDSLAAQAVDKLNLEAELEDLANTFTDRLGDISGPVVDGIERVGIAVFSVLTVLVLTFFMLVEGPGWIREFWKTQDPKNRAKHQKIAQSMYHVVTGYVNGQLLIAFLAGVTSLFVMLLLGIPFALPLAGVVGLFGLIPLIGATLGSVVVIAVAAFQGLPTAIAMLVFFLVYQQIENNVIQPFVQSRTLDVSPLLVLIAVLFGINIGGMLGGFAAIPAAACIRILINEKLAQRNEKATKKS